MSPQLDTRLERLKTELADHSRIATFLGLDFERPIRSLGDGYPENAISWVGKITERILKQLWRHHDIPGDPSGKSLSELIKGCQTHVASSVVLDALRDIQRLRNRSAHDGYEIADEDGLTAVRRLLDVLVWFTSTGSSVLTGDPPRLTPLVAKKAEFLAGLYLTLDFQLAKRFELSQHTVYQLFSRQLGLRTEYVELLLTRDVEELRQVLGSTGGELLRTRLPKLTRFLVVDEEAGEFEDYRVVTYDRFMDTVVDLDMHLEMIGDTYPVLQETTPESLPIAADLLSTDERSSEMRLYRLGDAMDMLADVAMTGGNVLVVGRSGSGKSTLLKRLVTAGRDADVRRYRFYFDMSLKRKDESFEDFVTRTLAVCMSVETSRVFDVFHYFARSGSVVCALDGIDEAVHETTLTGFLELFTELAEILSAESTIVMSSRVSFLEDSPEVRRLLDGTELMSEKLVQHLHAQGVDPLKVPRFSALRLRDINIDGAADGTPLELRLARLLERRELLPDLVWVHIEQSLAAAGLLDRLPQLINFFGTAALRGNSTFTLIDVCNALGIEAFRDARLAFDAFKLQLLFRPAGDDRVAFIHSAYQELLAAEYLRGGHGSVSPLLSEQTRAFLHHRARADALREDCVVPAGTYVVGPSHHLMLRSIDRSVRFDRYAVTVRRYKTFLEAIEHGGSQQWDHPETPAGHSHQPWRDRLRIPEYYDDPAYDEYPAVCISWWSAYAFARYEGKRLPTSLEWEAAARGTDGRLFPWGDDVDLEAVNCADSWSARPLVTYEAWKAEVDRGGLHDALPRPVTEHPRNRSPFGVHQMVGNVWELTSTTIADRGEPVICGGSFDNPYRAVQASSKGFTGRGRASNVIGFRCVEDV